MQDDLTILKHRIKKRIPNLTESQKRVANYIVESPQKFALSSIRELEIDLHTSKATIVRLAQVLGYKGFHELKSAFLKSIRRELDPINRYKSLLKESSKSPSISKSNFLELITDETITNIRETIILTDREQYDAAIQLLVKANHVYTMGLGLSTYIAEIASYLLNRISINSTAMKYGGMTFAEQIINFSQKDLILAFSFKPYSPETIEAAAYAHEKKIKVLALTDQVTSQIVQYSDAFLLAAVESVSISNSIAALMVLLSSIVTKIGHDFKPKTLETIKEIEHVREEHSGKKLKK